MCAEDALWVRDALECLRGLASGAEQTAYAALAARAGAVWQELRTRYRELAGMDLEPELDSRDAKLARRRAHGVPRAAAQRVALVDRLIRDMRTSLAYRHGLVMVRAGLRMGDEAYNLAHYEASERLGRLAPSLEDTAIGGKR